MLSKAQRPGSISCWKTSGRGKMYPKISSGVPRFRSGDEENCTTPALQPIAYSDPSGLWGRIACTTPQTGAELLPHYGEDRRCRHSLASRQPCSYLLKVPLHLIPSPPRNFLLRAGFPEGL